MRKTKTPWLDYAGQTTPEIIACKATHRIDSLLCALEEGILLRQSRNGEAITTPEESILLAVMALQREVNNGGYHQFFVNPSCEYAPMIVGALEHIGCRATSALTAKVIESLKLDELTAKAANATILVRDDERNRFLNSCDQEFYKLTEIQTKLFEFVESRPDRFILEKITVPPRPPRRGFTNVTAVKTRLEFACITDHSIDAVRVLARELAAKNEIAASDAEIEGAVNLHMFSRQLRSGDLAACDLFGPASFELAREDTTQCVLHKQWAEKLVAASKFNLADTATLQYLEYLDSEDKSSDFIRKRIQFWAGLIAKHPSALPNSAQFFRTRFPDISPGV